MTEQFEAVQLILNQLKSDGLEWFRNSVLDEKTFLQQPRSEGFGVFNGRQIHEIGTKPNGSFPGKKFLIMQPGAKETNAVLGLWLKWDFREGTHNFRLFLGQWSVVEKKKTFGAFRFETPETGDVHNYYHCQPCRNFGDKEKLKNSVYFSERFPTIPLNASNIVELTLCALLAALGRQKTKTFVRALLSQGSGSENSVLKEAYGRVLNVTENCP